MVEPGLPSAQTHSADSATGRSPLGMAGVGLESPVCAGALARCLRQAWEVNPPLPAGSGRTCEKGAIASARPLNGLYRIVQNGA